MKNILKYILLIILGIVIILDIVISLSRNNIDGFSIGSDWRIFKRCGAPATASGFGPDGFCIAPGETLDEVKRWFEINFPNENIEEYEFINDEGIAAGSPRPPCEPPPQMDSGSDGNAGNAWK